MEKQHCRVYSLQTRQKAAALYKQLQETGSCVVFGQEITTVKELCQLLDIKNESTVRTWAVKDWSKKAVKECLSHRGAKFKLSEDQKKKLLE